jgi:hemoglobin-like flavoprotein
MTNYESVFNESFGRILRMQEAGDAFFTDFYETFTASSPEVAEKFKNTDMEKQRRMLKASFYHMVSLSATKEVPDDLARIAETHNRDHYDIRPELYDLWMECLIRAVGRHDSRFTDDVELAWRLVMAKGIAYMKFRYAR